jgi:RimJ/RimL family protein N-acetyltransferase
VDEGVRLASARVVLRPYQPGDEHALYEAARESVAEVGAWLSWCHPDYRLEEARGWVEHCARAWQQGTEYEFATTRKSDGRFLGGCGLNHIDRVNRVANLGYWVRTSQTRRGVATAAALLLMQFGFGELKLNRIEVIAATGNVASQRVAEKIGATREGILRNRLAVHDRVFDAVIFSLLPQDAPAVA